ncbi:homeodomain-like protein [Tanacetum coccineum]
MDKIMEDVDKRVRWLQSEQYSSTAGGVLGEPQKTARVGDEYQAQIPSLMTRNERLQLILSPLCHDAKTDVRDQFDFGLSIHVSWVHNQHKKNKEETLIDIKAKGRKSGIFGYGIDHNVFHVPCSSNEESWSELEHDSFILGLYIFGKNFRVVNCFMGNKGMPHVLSYYYGKFYRSEQHQKWSTYIKKGRTKSSPGRKTLRGWRRQELLSRLFPHVSDECKTRLTQVISTFDEGKLSFEEYVFSLRDTVGIKLLVEAVAIGKEKQDLTAKDKRRSRKKVKNQSLNTEEIINILKDRIGLSKARLDELFWEGVWPRLLANGWHSEQPTNYASKHSLVFLPPDVAKYSRRGLVKGSQYFDSLTGVLNKVATEPQLLENKVDPHTKNGSEDEQDLVKCTVVDTSLNGLVKVKELTSLSDLEPTGTQTSSSTSGETKQDTAEESKKENVNQSVVKSPDCGTSDMTRDMGHMANHLETVVAGIGDKTDVSNNEQVVRKLKLVIKQKSKQHYVSNTCNENSCGEDPRPKKQKIIVMDLGNPRVSPLSDGNDLMASTKPSVSPETNTNHHELSSLVASNGQRQSTRSRPLTKKALEALANGFMDPKKKRKGLEDTTNRRVRAKTALVSSWGAPTLRIT